MRNSLLGILAAVIGSAVITLLVLGQLDSAQLPGPERVLAWTVGISLLIISFITLATSLSGRTITPAALRLDLYLPFLHKQKKNAPAKTPALIVRIARKLLPAALLADSVKGKPGLIRRWLKRTGPSWLSSDYDEK